MQNHLFTGIRKPFLYAFAVTLGLLAATGVLAWTGPSASPPTGNASAPLNISNAGQVKVGGLQLNTGGAATGLIVTSGATNLGGGSNGNWAPLNVGTNGGATSINAAGPIYSYTAVCVGNNSGTCTAAGGVVVNTTGITFPDGTRQTTAAAGSASPAWTSITGMPSFGTNQVNGRVRMYEVGCGGSWASSCDANTNGQVDIADTANAVTFNGGLTTASSPTFAGLTLNGGLVVNAGANYGTNVYSTNQPALYGHSDSSYGVYAHSGTSWGGVILQDSGNTGLVVERSDGAVYSELMSSGYGLLTNQPVLAPAFYYNSDERLKKNIQAIASSTALQDILALQPVTYNWIDPTESTTTQLGFIAQQVQKVVPEIVTTNASTTMEAVDYARVTPLLVGAAQAQQAQIDAQQKEIDALTAEVAALKAGK